MLEELKYQVCGANLELVARGVVIYTWGNVSGIDRDKGLVVIKPSGVVYDNSVNDIIVVDGLIEHKTLMAPYFVIKRKLHNLKFKMRNDKKI